MEEKKGIGVIGYGVRIKQILELLLNTNPKHKIVALCDLQKKAIDNYKKTFGENIKIYDDYNLLINDPDVKWVFIGSWNSAHKEQILASLKAEKNILCEKPLAISISECEEIKKLYQEKNVNFLIDYPLRYSPHYIKIKEIIDKGKIGKIVSIEFNQTLDFTHGAFIMSDWRRLYKYSGGHMVEKCCHDIDIVNWLTKSIPKRIASFGDLNFFNPENSSIFEKIQEDKIELKYDGKLVTNPFISDKDIIDNQVVIIEYANNIKATFHTNLNVGIPERRLYICGTKGTIRADLRTRKIEVKRIGSPEKPIEVIDGENKGGHGGGDQILIKELDNAILNNITPKTSMDDAIKSTVTAIAIDKSMKTGKVIEMDPTWKKFGY